MQFILQLEKIKVRLLPLVLTPLLVCGAGLAQSDLPRFGIGVDMSTLGAGIEAATAVTRKSNARVGFNDFSYSRDLHKDGINYSGELQLRSFEILYDQYLVGGLHISPGLLAYNGNRANATAAVPGGQTFSLGGVTYMSAASNPVTGTGTVNLGTTAPEVLLGFGNLLPRSGRHFTVNFEFGAVFQQSPKATLNLNGTVCDQTGVVCAPVSSYPGLQANIQNEQTKINNDLNFFRYYPVIRFGIGYKF